MYIYLDQETPRRPKKPEAFSSDEDVEGEESGGDGEDGGGFKTPPPDARRPRYEQPRRRANNYNNNTNNYNNNNNKGHNNNKGYKAYNNYKGGQGGGGRAQQQQDDAFDYLSVPDQFWKVMKCPVSAGLTCAECRQIPYDFKVRGDRLQVKFTLCGACVAQRMKITNSYYKMIKN